MGASSHLWLCMYTILLFLCAVQAASFSFFQKRCLLTNIPMQTQFNMKKFTGSWFEIAQVHHHGDDIMSAVSHFDITKDGKLKVDYGGTIAGKCITPYTSVSTLPLGDDAKMTFTSAGPFTGTHWVVSTDYFNYALIYGCNKYETLDAECPLDQRSVKIFSRKPEIDAEFRVRLEYAIERELCVDPEDLRLVSQEFICPPMSQMHADEPANENPGENDAEDSHNEEHEICVYADIPVAESFDVETVGGIWYILATWRESSESTRSAGVFDLVPRDDGYIDTYFTGAHNGACLPTFYGVMTSTDVTGQYSVQNEFQDGPIKFTYFTADHQYGVTYQCTGVHQDGSCEKATIDVYGRTTAFPEEVRAELRTHVEAMCVKPDQFMEISHNITCDLSHKHTDDVSCLVADVKSASNVNWHEQVGTWFTVAAFQGRAAPSLTWFVEDGEEDSVHYNWMGYARNEMCVKPVRVPATLHQADGHIEVGAEEKKRDGKIIFTDNKNLLVYYECTRLLEDGTCDPQHNKLHFNTRSRDTPKHVIRSLKVMLDKMCYKLSDIQAVSQKVPCEADPEKYVANPLPKEEPVQLPEIEHPIEHESHESHESHKSVESIEEHHDDHHFEGVHSQEEFDAEKFAGVWYHAYRLKWSHHKYESEVDYVKLQEDGTLKAWSRHYHDGRCSKTESSVYTQSKEHQGDWSFDVYGGLKVLYTCYEHAVLYICDHVERDGHCKHEHLEVEVLSRTKAALSGHGIEKMLEAIKAVNLTKADFEAVDNTAVCELTKSGCGFNDLPHQEHFNMDKFTGTWHLLAHTTDRNIQSATLRFVKSESGYITHMKFKRDGACSNKSLESSVDIENAVISSDSGNAVIKVLYTDYEHALLYTCLHLSDDGKCEPNMDSVTLSGRSYEIDDKKIRTLASVAFESCFTQGDFKRISHTDLCDYDLPKYSIADLPKAEDFDVSKFVGTWYGLYRLRGRGVWSDGVLQYELLENGNLKASGTSFVNGECGGTKWYVALPGEHPYEWREAIGANVAYVRILDANVEGDNHAVLYHCDQVEADGSCDPERAYIEVLSRKKEEFPEETLAHLRTVVRQAGYEPGDFVKAFDTNVHCEVEKVGDFACDVDSIPAVKNFNTRRFSGYWYVVAKLKGSYIPAASALRYQIFDDGTFNMYITGYRLRRGCVPTTHVSGNLIDGAEFTVEVHGHKTTSKVVWTDYTYALVHTCLMTLDDGSCATGFSRTTITSRYTKHIPEDVIIAMNRVSDQQCNHRENFEYINHDVECHLDVPTVDSCKWENVQVVENFNKSMMDGQWYMRYRSDPKRKSLSFSTVQYNYIFNDDGSGQSLAAFESVGKCYSARSYFYLTKTPGEFSVRLGRHTIQTKVLFQSEKYLINYLCGHVQEDGFCDPSDRHVAAFSRSMDDVPEEVLDKAGLLAQTICMEPGDFIPVHHSRAHPCPFPDPPVAHTCKFDDLPLQKNCSIERFTGTWYAVAKIKGSLVRPSTSIRVERQDDETYHVLFTGLKVDGTCHHTKSAKVIPSDTGCVFTLDYGENQGQMRVLYTDYWHALVYECLQVQDDGTCAPGSDAIAVFSRNHDLPAGVIEKLVPVAEDACYKKEDFKRVSHPVECEIESEHPNACKVRNIPVQDNLDLERFSGEWYSHYKLVSEWDTVVFQYEKDEDGTMRTYYGGEVNGRCVRPYRIALTPSPGRPAVMTNSLKDRFIESRIVYTDYQYALIYNCEQVLSDGSCEPGQMYIDAVSRSLDPMPTEAREKLKKAIRETCHEPGDFVESPHQVVCSARPVTCAISTLGEQKDLDMGKFTGHWNIILGLKNTDFVESGSINMVTTENGFTGHVVGKRTGTCLTKTTEMSWEKGTGVLNFDDGTGLVKVLYTDYQYGLVYICRKLHGKDACVPGYDVVYGISRTTTIDDSHLRAMVDAAAETCFLQEHFEWIKETGQCEVDRHVCKVPDMPKAEDFEVSKIVGRWYGRYHLRGHGDWQDGVMEYELMENGHLRVSTAGSLNGACVSSSTLMSEPGDHVYEWKIKMGGKPAYIRILDANKEGDNHMVIYECDLILEDGSCDPDREFVDILTRTRDTLSEDTIAHLREVVLAACFEPGDFEEVTRHEGLECPITHQEVASCKFDELPAPQDFDPRKVTGTWYTVARMDGTNVLTQGKSRWQHNDDDTYNVYLRMYRPRRGCQPTVKHTGAINGSSYTSEFGDTKLVMKIVWTNYDVMLAIDCSNIQEDGSCPDGYMRGVVLSREPGMISEEVITEMTSVSDQACIQREHYQYVKTNAYCDPEVPKLDTCKVGNIVTASNVNKETLAGEWILRYALRSEFSNKVNGFHTRYDYLDSGDIETRWSMHVGDECRSGTGLMYQTATSGYFVLRYGHIITHVRVLFVGENYMVTHLCGDVTADGYCNPHETSLSLMSRSRDPVPKEILDEAESLAHRHCYEFGDFVPVAADRDEPCPIPSSPHEIGCGFTELPYQDHFNMEKQTGTWYAVAKLKGHMVAPSLVIRIFKISDVKYGIIGTSSIDLLNNFTRPRGGCHHGDSAGFIATDNPAAWTIKYGPTRANLRVLYSDYEYTMMYYCLDVLDDGHCKPEAESIVVYSRHPSLPDDAVQRMIPVAEKACYTRHDFEIVPRPGECELPTHNPAHCKIRDIHVQDHLDLQRFLGTWYSRFKLASDWDTAIYEFDSAINGTVRLQARGQQDGHCTETSTYTHTVSKGNSGVFYNNWEGHLAEMKIVYTDYNYAIIYTCAIVKEDGTCTPGHLFLNVMSRTLDEIPAEDLSKLREEVRVTCYEPGDFIESVHDRHCAPHDNLGCAFSELPVQEDFNMDKFTGKWLVVARLRNTGTIDSGVMGITASKAGEYLAYVAGSKDGKCTPTKHLTLHPGHKGNQADVHIVYGKKEGIMRILYTDYHMALVYLCTELQHDGVCSPGALKVLALGRSEAITNNQLRIMGGVAKQACFSPDQFEWVDREVECKLDIDLANRCKPMNIPTAKSVEAEGLMGNWFVRYSLRESTEFDSAVFGFELLSSGNVKFSATGAKSGTCIESTSVSLVYHTDDPAVWHLRYNVVGEPGGFVKVLYLDSEYAVFYECAVINEEEFCDWDKVQVTVVSRSKTAAIPEEMIQKLISVGRGACFEPGMFFEMSQGASCEIGESVAYSCEGEKMPSVEDFNMEKLTGTWYGVARLKGSSVSNSAVLRISKNDDDTYKLQLRGSKRGPCTETTVITVVPAEDGLSELHSFNKDGVKQGLSRVLHTDYETCLVYTCILLQEDGTCSPGHDTVVVYARTPDVPGDDVIAKMAAAGEEVCVNKEQFEPIPHHKSCPIDTPIPDTCLEANIKAEPDFSMDNFTGTWYTLYRLRDSGNMDFGMAKLSKVDDHHMLGEFAFSVHGECVSVDTMYHHTHKDSHSGDFYTNIGRFQASVKILATDYNYAILYECEHVDADGLCSKGGKFVGIFGRSPDPPSEDVRAKLRRITRDVCLEPGDFVATKHTSECEIKINKAKVQCKLSDLPAKKNHVFNKDTGSWYAVAKLRGSNFLNSHVERGVFDEEKQMYSFYFAGERARGGCTPTGRTDVPLQVLGEATGIVELASGSHKGQWRVLYNDYKYSLYYECNHMLDDDTCAPGYETVMAYSRKPEHIPETQIVAMFEKIPGHCFTREDFEWIPQNAECSLEFNYPDCRVRTIPAVEHFDIDKVVGKWYSRYLLISHARFDSVGVRFEKTEHGLKGYYSATKNGVCQRTMEIEHDISNHNRGVWHRIKDGKRVTTKVMWTDYEYIAVYTCDEVLQDDNCAPGMDYIDVLAKHLEPVPVVVIEKLKKVLKTGCYEPGDFVESDHNLKCDERSCKVEGVITADEFHMSQIYGTWHLLGRTTHLSVERGPSTMQLMKGSEGTGRISMARQHEYGCNTYQGAIKPDGDATFKFRHSGLPGILKVLHVTDELLMIYECFGVEPGEDGYCPEENEEIQVWGRSHSAESKDRFALIREVASKRTCVNLQNSVYVKDNTECEVPRSCHWDDFVGMESFDPRSVLGEWTIVGQSTGHETTYNTGGIKYAHTNGEDGVYTFAGSLTAGEECGSHTGTITYVEPTVYNFHAMDKDTLVRFLYVDDDRHIILECRAELDHGYCPKGHAVGYVFARNHAVTEEGTELVLREMRERTHNCYDLSELQVTKENECAVPDPQGKQSCAVEAIEQADINPEDFVGAWFLIARSSNIDLHWDAGVLHSTLVDGGVFQLKYTGLVSYDNDECLEVYTEEMHPVEGKKGQFDVVTERLGGLKSTAKILYADDDHFIWYECQGNAFTSYGACKRDKEHVEVFSRRRKVNSIEKQRLSTIIKEKTCMDLGNFVMANHTKRCELPGITDTHHHDEKSCKVVDYTAQKDFDAKKFAGVWYEIERTRYSAANAWESGLAKYEVKEGNALGFSYAGTRDGDCRGPFKGYGKPVGTNNGDLLMYVGGEESYGSPWSVHFTYKVLYTDYKVAITYACMFWNDDGTCRRPGEQVDILSRHADLDSETRSRLYEIIRERLCVDVYDLVEPAREDNCHVLVGAVDCSKRPMCMIECEHGFVKDNDGCDTCKCAVDCSMRPMCMIECEHGFVKDNDGCDTCKCAIDCSMRPMCMIECEHGFVKGSDGCDTCKCAVDCSMRPMCAMECEHGFVKGSDGCDTCKCAVDCSMRPMCAMECEHGFVKGSDGCDTCKCAADCSMRPMCMIECEHGFVKGSDGCHTCKCVETESHEGSGEEEPQQEQAESGDGEMAEHHHESVEEHKHDHEVEGHENEAEAESHENEAEGHEDEAEEEAGEPEGVEENEDDNEADDENEAEDENQAIEEAQAASAIENSFMDSLANWFN